MNSNFVYQVPTKVYFGDNQLGNLGDELKKYGKRILMVYGGGSIKKIGLYDRVTREIRQAGYYQHLQDVFIAVEAKRTENERRYDFGGCRSDWYGNRTQDGLWNENPGGRL